MGAPGAAPTVLQSLAALSVADVPASVAARVPDRVLDTLGVAIRATQLDTSAAAVRFAVAQGTAPQATAIGADAPMSAAEAAFVNGVLAHSLDYDDTHLPSILHPSASVVPAALAAGESLGSSGAEVVAAIAVGLEVNVRIGMGGFDPAQRQSVYFERGQHATSICGAMGSAAAVARLFGRDADLAQHAMGVAASMASGIIEANRTGGTVKRLHCGWAARCGVTAALLAREGFTGAPTAIEGRFGLFTALLGDEGRPDAVVADLGERWESERIFIKPYPANHFTHTGIDAALAMRANGVRPADVATATLFVAPPTVRTIGEPMDVKRRPATGYQAQFSGPYTVAAALFGGGGLGLGLGDFTDELASDPERRALMERIDVVGDDSLNEVYPYQFPGRLELSTRDGTVLTEDVPTNRGGPERPLSADELAHKFDDNVAGLIAADARAELVERVMQLHADDDLATLMPLAVVA